MNEAVRKILKESPDYISTSLFNTHFFINGMLVALFVAAVLYTVDLFYILILNKFEVIKELLEPLTEPLLKLILTWLFLFPFLIFYARITRKKNAKKK